MALGTKPRWDKYDGYMGNFRAPLAADIVLATHANKVLGAGVNSDGAVVFGVGQTGLKALVIVDVGDDMSGHLLTGGTNVGAGDIMDCGKHGEIVNFQPSVISNSFALHVDAVSGTYAPLVNGTATAGIAFGAVDTALKAAIVAVDDAMTAAQVTVVGTAPDFTVTLPVGKTLASGTGVTVTAPTTVPAAGTNYFAHADGSVNATKGADGVFCGHTVEKDRLIVNFNDEA